jgi:outer membrane receptor protein involved in Fe transport
MKKTILLTSIFSILLFSCMLAQKGSISGQLNDPDQQAVIFANVVLYTHTDSSLIKVETTDENGIFQFQQIPEGQYYLTASYVGLNDIRIDNIAVDANMPIELGKLNFASAGIELETAVVTATRAIVEVKPDRTVFNVQGTINSVGDNGLGLLRKAPGVLVDNNNNISVLSRSGVLLYVDGKVLPLSGQDLTSYLENLPAEQIDRIDIITNPGAKYEAEGNAGIIDIRLKKDKNHGTNGNLSGSFGKGKYARGNVNLSGNYRNKIMNTFATLGYSKGDFWNKMNFQNYQNDFLLNEEAIMLTDRRNINGRIGTDFYLGKNEILGFLVTTGDFNGAHSSTSRNEISQSANPAFIDSILIAENISDISLKNTTYNINYRYNNDGTSLNIDADYGRYRKESDTDQPNQYYSADESKVLSEVISAYTTPVEIDIYTFKIDYEKDLWGGKAGIGTKLSNVETDNTFLFYDVESGVRIQNNRRSNLFKYDERVYAGYVSYGRALSDKWNFMGGVRLEQTDAMGELEAFLPELQESPVELNYLSVFPNVGLSYSMTPEHVFNLNYGRRINRPDYNVLNPFKEQISELSFSKGNPFLKPEIVNNLELGYTLKYRYNFKLSYSKTLDQITRLIGPDDSDPRAGFINWDNLATQTIYSLNISLPLEVTKIWNAYLNLSGSYKKNQAEYEGGAIVDLSAWSYNMYQQHTFDLPKGFKAEVSGWFSGPGIWGGVFEYETSWSLNLGLQKRFFNDQMNVRLSAQDLFFQSGWSGQSQFDGLLGIGQGNWDSRRVEMSISYSFGNSNIKSQNRKTGLEEESQRVAN